MDSVPVTQPELAKEARKSPVPAPGNPDPEDKFVYVRHCARTKRDITIAYQTFGDKKHPCLLLVSGLGSTLHIQREQLCQKLADAGFYVVRFDNRDVGLSTHLDGLPTPFLPRMILPGWMSVGEGEPPYLLEDMALDALNLLTALGIERAHVAGGSMGGMIVQCMAILQPERILSLTIIFSHSGGPNVKPQTFGMSLSFLDKPSSDSREDQVAFKVRTLKRFTGLYKLNEEETIALTNKILDRCADDNAGFLRQTWAIQRSPSRVEDLQRIRNVPTLIIHGLQDTMIPAENGLQLCQLIDGSKMVVFPRMGHWIPPELYDEVVKELCFLRERSN